MNKLLIVLFKNIIGYKNYLIFSFDSYFSKFISDVIEFKSTNKTVIAYKRINIIKIIIFYFTISLLYS